MVLCQLGSDPSRQDQHLLRRDRMARNTIPPVGLGLWCKSVLYRRLCRRNPCGKKLRCLSFRVGNQGSRHSSQRCGNRHGKLDSTEDRFSHKLELLTDTPHGSCDQHHGRKTLVCRSKLHHYGSQGDIFTSKRVHHRRILLCTRCSKVRHSYLRNRGTSHHMKLLVFQHLYRRPVSSMFDSSKWEAIWLGLKQCSGQLRRTLQQPSALFLCLSLLKFLSCEGGSFAQRS